MKKKIYRLTPSTLDKIEKLKKAKELENPGIKIYEKDIIIDSIDLSFSSKFGKDVFDDTMTKLELVLGNMMKNVLNEFVVNIAEALDKMYMQNIEVKEMLLFILKANDILPNNQYEIAKLLMKNEELNELIQNAIDMKEQIHN